jgi:hypothetical protein
MEPRARRQSGTPEGQRGWLVGGVSPTAALSEMLSAMSSLLTILSGSLSGGLSGGLAPLLRWQAGLNRRAAPWGSCTR